MRILSTSSKAYRDLGKFIVYQKAVNGTTPYNNSVWGVMEVSQLCEPLAGLGVVVCGSHSPGLALELAELLGGPGGQGLGFGGLGAPALCQQVVDERAHLHQLRHVLPKRGAEVTESK